MDWLYLTSPPQQLITDFKSSLIINSLNSFVLLIFNKTLFINVCHSVNGK